LPGDEPDFWEGPQWNALGFIVQYLWAIGIVVAVSLLLPMSYSLLYAFAEFSKCFFFIFIRGGRRWMRSCHSIEFGSMFVIGKI
jgi:hypothetical protein